MTLPKIRSPPKNARKINLLTPKLDPAKSTQFVWRDDTSTATLQPCMTTQRVQKRAAQASKGANPLITPETRQIIKEKQRQQNTTLSRPKVNVA